MEAGISAPSTQSIPTGSGSKGECRSRSLCLALAGIAGTPEGRAGMEDEVVGWGRGVVGSGGAGRLCCSCRWAE